ncbi:MAG: GNAT family N-acetyltransferase [Anaerolineae bacterium]|nr:GNAT family N-acetyltransferase [Anaerolineae bacterium]
MQIVDLFSDNQQMIEQMTAVLHTAFRAHYPDSWPDLESARAEVEEFFDPERICRVAVADDGTVLGWVGASREYNGRAWELHPLAIHPAYQGQGVGRALITDLEAQVRARGGVTIFLGTDDEDNQTNLSNNDLYPNPLEHLARIQNRNRHPFEFYQKVGFVIVGVIPDANGPGKPDILMAKRVSQE